MFRMAVMERNYFIALSWVYGTTGTCKVPTKLTDQNRITLPLSVTEALGPVEYFEITVEGGQIILTPIKIQRSDAVREKLAELKITEQDVVDAIAWAREGSTPQS